MSVGTQVNDINIIPMKRFKKATNHTLLDNGNLGSE